MPAAAARWSGLLLGRLEEEGKKKKQHDFLSRTECGADHGWGYKFLGFSGKQMGPFIGLIANPSHTSQSAPLGKTCPVLQSIRLAP
jgi:hypothetical protein